MLKLLTTAIAVTFNILIVLTLFSAMGRLTDWWHWHKYAGIGESWAQHAEQTPWREMCYHDIWGGFTTSHCPALFRFSFLISSLLLLVVNMFVCYIHLILHDMGEKKKVSWHDLLLSIFVIFKLHGGWLPFMLVPCCFGDIITVITCLWHAHACWEK